MKRWQRRLLVLAACLLLLGGIGFGYWRYRFPYGWSHRCDQGLYVALRAYAEAHDGRFPAGESSPEASLSLLHRERLIPAAILRGKTVPEAIVTQRLEAGQLLSPDTCGWHYVEGLATNSDPRIALFWDKVPLGHNGERLADGSHGVMLVSGERRFIPASEWQSFLTVGKIRDGDSVKPLITRSREGVQIIGNGAVEARFAAACFGPGDGDLLRVDIESDEE